MQIPALTLSYEISLSYKKSFFFFLILQVLTKDSVTVSVDAVVYYRVSNPTISVANVENAHHSTRLLAQTTLRNILGTKNMSEILSDRESISHGMQVIIELHKGLINTWHAVCKFSRQQIDIYPRAFRRKSGDIVIPPVHPSVCL